MAEQWVGKCKDCGEPFGYSDASYQADLARGFSPPERCAIHRKQHSREIKSIGLSHYKLQPLSNLPSNFVVPSGTLGKLQHDLPKHQLRSQKSNFANFCFGITELDILRLYATLGARFEITSEIQSWLDDEKTELLAETHTEETVDNAIRFGNRQVVIVEGPTGSGKSTFLPYRLLVPPSIVSDQYNFSRRGQIIVTQPRIQAAKSIPKFVAEQLHGSSLGPGYDVGYKYHNASETDRRNGLVFVTDGTLINWIINEQLGSFSVIMVDEAHERSLNIDLILGLLKARLARYPQLKLIIASATISAEDFINYYGGNEKVGHLKFRGLAKPVEPHFSSNPILDYDNLLRKRASEIDEVAASAVTEQTLQVLDVILKGGPAAEGDILAFLHSEKSIDRATELMRHAIQKDRRLEGTRVFRLYRNVPSAEQDEALENKAQVISEKIIRFLQQAKSKARTAYPILALVLDERTAIGVKENLLKASGDWQRAKIEIAVEDMDGGTFRHLSMELRNAGSPYILIATYKAYASAGFPTDGTVIEDRRVIVSTNVAETSLTVDGVVYVVDSGLIKQTTWDPGTLTQRLVSTTHSRAGCMQRRGRAGRIRPGHAFFLYTKEQFDTFEAHTPPEIQRAPLEAVVLAAKAAGVSDISTFDWFQRTPAMDMELARSQSALVARHVLDKDTDITEHGLELRALALDTNAANLLLTADRFSCAVEVATLIPMLLMQKSLQGGLWLWDPNWDAATRWEVKRRQNALRGGCQDDLDLCMKIMAAWEASGVNYEERSAWSKQFWVNHMVLADLVRSEREDLLDHLAIGTKGNTTRAIDFDLIDRVRLVLAYSLPDQFGSSDQYTIASESICYGQTLPTFLYGRRIPFRKVEGKPDYHVSLIVRMKPEWRDVSKLSPFELGRLISSETRSDKGGALYRSTLWQQMPLLDYTIGATYACRSTQSPRVHCLLEYKDEDKPLPKVHTRSTGGYIRAEEEEEELEIEGARLPERKGKHFTNYEADESEEKETDTSPEPSPRIRLLCTPPLPSSAWQKVDLYLDGDRQVKELVLTSGITPFLELQSGNHELQVVPTGQALGSEVSCKYNVTNLKDQNDYSLVMGAWDQKASPAAYLVLDLFDSFSQAKAQLRWVFVGEFRTRLEVFVNNQPVAPGVYRIVDSHRPTRIRVHVKGEQVRGEPPLLEDQLKPSAGESYTAIITPGAIGTPTLTIVAEGVRKDSPQGDAKFSKQKDRPHAFVPAEFPAPPSDNKFHAQIEGYEFRDLAHPSVRLLPVGVRSPFELFVQQYRKGQPISVVPVSVESYPERRRISLIVREVATQLEMAVEADEIAYADQGIEFVLQDLVEAGQPVGFVIEDIDNGHQRVYLTYLPLLDGELGRLLESGSRITVPATARRIIAEDQRAGLILTYNASAILIGSAFVSEISVAQSGLKAYKDFQQNEPVQVQLNYIGGWIPLDAWPEEAQAALSKSSPAGIEKSAVDGKVTLRLNRPMRFTEREELLRASNNRPYQEAIRALYRRSNIPKVDLIDQQKINLIDSRYPRGVIVTGCLVDRVDAELIQVRIEPNILGSIHISEWSTEFTEEFQSKEGNLVDALVLKREDNGFLRLSRRQAGLAQYQENTRYQGVVSEINSGGAEVLLVRSENGETIQQPMTGFAPKSHIQFKSKAELENFDPSTVLRIGQHVNVRIIDIDRDRANITLTICRLYEMVVHVSAQTDISRFLGEKWRNLRALETSTGTNIFIEKERGLAGTITVYSDDARKCQRATQEIKQRLSGVQESRPTIPRPVEYRYVQANPTGSPRPLQPIARRERIPTIPAKPRAPEPQAWVWLAVGATVLLCALLALVGGGLLYNYAFQPVPTQTIALPTLVATPSSVRPLPTNTVVKATPLPTQRPPSVTPLPVSAKVIPAALNVRIAPTANARVVGSLKKDSQIILTGRSGDNKWYQVRLQGIPDPGWVSAESLQISSGNPLSLPVVTAPAP